MERTARREQLRLDEAQRLEQFQTEEGEQLETADAMPDDVPEELDQTMIDRLKNIIQTWDSQSVVDEL